MKDRITNWLLLSALPGLITIAMLVAAFITYVVLIVVGIMIFICKNMFSKGMIGGFKDAILHKTTALEEKE